MGLNLPNPLHMPDPLGVSNNPTGSLFPSYNTNFGAAQQKAQAQADAAIASINAAYSDPSRQQQYTDYYNAVLGAQQQSLADQQAAAERQTKFALARSGIAGGSQGSFTTQQLGKDIANASSEAVTRALGAQAGLETADQQQKQQLTALAESGALNTGASDAASQAMATALSNAQSQNISNDFSNFFSNLTPIYQASVQADAMRRLGNFYYQQRVYNQNPLLFAGSAGWQ